MRSGSTFNAPYWFKDSASRRPRRTLKPSDCFVALRISQDDDGGRADLASAVATAMAARAALAHFYACERRTLRRHRLYNSRRYRAPVSAFGVPMYARAEFAWHVTDCAAIRLSHRAATVRRSKMVTATNS